MRRFYILNLTLLNQYLASVLIKCRDSLEIFLISMAATALTVAVAQGQDVCLAR